MTSAGLARSRATGPVRPAFARASAAIAALGVVVAIVFLALLPGQDLHRDRPLALFERIADHPGLIKVLNTYNVSGPLLWFGGGPSHVQVAIDGRTDKYGAYYIDTYLDTLLAARPGWVYQFNRLDPDIAVLYNNEALVSALENERDWRPVAEQDGVVLLVPPDATGPVGPYRSPPSASLATESNL